MAKEIRQLVSRVEIRADEVKFQLSGTAVAYNTLSANNVPYPGWREQVAPGAFRATLGAANADVKAFWSHDPSKVLGRQKNSTLTLTDSPSGLRYVVQLDRNSQAHRDCFASVQRRDVDSMSFGFICNDEDDDRAAKIRTVKAATLLEISFVAEPAYDHGTSAEARKYGYGKKSPATSADQLAASIKILRRAVQISIREKVRELREQIRQGGSFSQEDFASLAGHLESAHSLAECAHAINSTVRDILDAKDGDAEFDADEGYRCFNETHKLSHAHTELACSRLAEARLGLSDFGKGK